MGNSRNRVRIKSRSSLSRKRKNIQDGIPSYKDPGPSAKKIDKNVARFAGISTGVSTNLKEGTIFMDLSVLFGVFEDVMKYPECASEISSHVDMNKKNGYSHYIVLECKSTECDWEYCFNTSKKQGHSHEVNVRAVLALREIGRGHTRLESLQNARPRFARLGKRFCEHVLILL